MYTVTRYIEDHIEVTRMDEDQVRALCDDRVQEWVWITKGVVYLVLIDGSIISTRKES